MSSASAVSASGLAAGEGIALDGLVKSFPGPEGPIRAVTGVTVPARGRRKAGS